MKKKNLIYLLLMILLALVSIFYKELGTFSILIAYFIGLGVYSVTSDDQKL